MDTEACRTGRDGPGRSHGMKRGMSCLPLPY
jgi:hypothetical protein